MTPSRAALSLLLVGVVAVSGCATPNRGGGDPHEAVKEDGSEPAGVECPDLPITAEATMLFDPGLMGPGTFDVDVEADGVKETCTVTLDAPSPAVHMNGAVGMSRTNDATTCKLVALDGHFSDGSLSGLSRPGKTAELKLTVREGAKVIGEGTFHPDYTPDACGQMTRHQKFPITR